ncbi:MAG: response regulator, partial [Spirochaetota bacterium]
YGIVRQLDGHIRVHSAPGRGTVFTLYFPVTEQQPAGGDVVEEPDGDLEGSERVLVVEDEDLVRMAAVSILEMYGYQVAGVKDGEEALALLRETDPPFDLLITDMVMPRVNGRELAARARKERPGLKVIYMSGFQEHILFSATAGEGSSFLEKPFSPRELARTVRRVLRGPAAPRA